MTEQPTILRQFAEFAANTEYSSLPDTVIHSIKDRILDTIGISLAAVPLETSQMAAELATTWGGIPEASIIGFSRKLPAMGAAFVNGVLAHSLDFDDTHLPSVLHPSASVLPSTLAVAEATGSSVKSTIASAATGYEVCIRSGMAAYDPILGNSIFFENGWHATSICGALASAVAAAKLYGLDVHGIGHAIGIAASMASGILEGNRSGGSVKRLHCGWAAHAGIVAAQAARAGFTAPLSTFEGRFGFYRAFCQNNFDGEAISKGLGTDWSIPGIFYKPYPANHFIHAGIDAALMLRPLVSVDDIADIELRVPTAVLRTISEPAETKYHPQSGYQAKFSGPFVIATTLLGGGGLGIYLDDFTDARVHDDRVLALAAKVRCAADSECDAVFPKQFPAVLRVRTRKGANYERKVMSNRGGGENPLSHEELHRKFLFNAKRIFNESSAEELASMIGNLEEFTIRDLMEYASVGVMRTTRDGESDSGS